MQPIDYAPIYDKALGEFANDRGLLPVPLQRLGYGQLDRLVRTRLTDRGIERFNAGLYETALRAVVREIMAEESQIRPGPPRLNRVGADLADRADKILTAKGKTMADATTGEYFEALGAAQDALDLEHRRDLLAALKARLADYRDPDGTLIVRAVR
jgi:hypothetical protein